MEGMIGEVRMFAGNFAPKNWAFCQGALININSNTALFSILGTTYGGNGTTNFALPNLASRVALGRGQGPGLEEYDLGQVGGSESVTLLTQQIPVHNHLGIGTYAPPANSTSADESNPTGGYMAKSGVGDLYASGSNGSMGATPVNLQIGPSGGSQPHNNQQPFLGMNYVICMYGIYPSRN
jgi:microcystin-dependent protein